ncbi:MAG: class I tRNA ligase family protein, partial [Acidobacteriota bacterium]
SRQRYWGEPFPILHVLGDDGEPTGEILTVDREDLPVELPQIDEYRPTDDGQPPLARAEEDWLLVTLPDGRKARRETNTMPQWAGSCWYYLRYMDARNEAEPFGKEAENYWMPVDLYIGGVEHAVLHLLYSRFWHKVLFDAGLVSTKEPFQKLFNQGMILSYSYQDNAGKYYSPDDVDWQGERVFNASGELLTAKVEKMSKSKLNVASPDDVIDSWGADTLRLYELFMGPLEQQKPWQMKGAEGVHRFLQRVWRLVVDENTGDANPKLTDDPGRSEAETWQLLHKTIHKVQQDTEGLTFNTAISQMMIFTNAATSAKALPRETVSAFVRVLSPWAPHLAEELWQRLGHDGLACQQDWPEVDESLLVDDTISLVVQVNGKKRDELSVSKDTSKDELESLALASEKAQKFIEGKEPRKVIVVPGRLVNIVV